MRLGSDVHAELDALLAPADAAAQARVAAARAVFESGTLAEQWPPFFTNLAYDTYLVEAS